MTGGTVAERKVKVLTAKKESLFTNLQSLYDLSKKVNDPVVRKKFEIMVRSLDSTRSQLLQTVDEVNEKSLEVDEDFIPNFSVYHVIEEMCCNIKECEEKIRNENTAASTSTNSTHSSQGSPRLPKIELPDFSGDIREWETFYSVFKNLIHDNSSLTDVDRMYYLVGRLKGSALRVCSGIAPTGNNYPIIWQSLINKYQDQRALANSYLNQIMDFKRLTSESSSNLNLFLEKVDSAVRALKQLGLHDLSDFMFVYLSLSKLDMETSKAFEMLKRGSGIPKYDDLITFVKEQSKILANRKPIENTTHTRQWEIKSKPPKSFMARDNSSKMFRPKTEFCQFCHTRGHNVGRCDKFKRLTPGKRYETVKNNNWCFNCFSSSHGVRFCSIERTCAECAKKHHILLHLGKPNSIPIAGTSDSTGESSNMESNSIHNIPVENGGSTFAARQIGCTVLLPTVVVRIINSQVENNVARFILDSGSQIHLFTVKGCKRLGINIKKYYSSIQGIGNNSQPVKGTANLIISSRYDVDKTYSIRTLITEKISEKLPRVLVNENEICDNLGGIQLADENFYQPGEIDGIIGAELFTELIKSGRIVDSNGSPIAVETVFGYVIMGKIPMKNLVSEGQTFLALTDEIPVENLVNKFWEIEQVPKCSPPDPDEVECEKLYLSGYSRDISGRFTVALPFKYSPACLGDSSKAARLRLFSLERKFMKIPHLRSTYNEIMKDFIDQGHMRLVLKDSFNTPNYYMPHHSVYKPESSSTPVRVVLDASFPSDSDISLNDLLYSGPKLQTDIVTQLINFRLFKIAITSDLRQMYRQINIIEKHRRFQRLFWRFDLADEIQTYEISTVAFGVKSSPYLALKTVRKLIEEEGEQFPVTSRIILRDLYIDDLVSSVNTEVEAVRLYEESTKIFAAGGFDLTKWATNSNSLSKKIPTDKQLLKTVLFQTDTKILGLQWNPQLDMLSFQLTVPDSQGSKRKILSSIARCYDPIGLIGPFIFYLKLLVKELWRLKLGWDDEPPDEISRRWNRVRSEWSELHSFQVRRSLGAEADNPVIILAFGDASQDGYGAVVYLRTITSNGNVNVNLVCAKSKVSPFKLLTIPRLELCAAVLLSNLVKHVIDTYTNRVFISKVYAFSDSTTVIQWLQSNHLKEMFVANRVQHIREQLPKTIWLHISGDTNPADCLSRGLTPVQLINHTCWLRGPDWISLTEENWPVSDLKVVCEQIPERKVFLTKETVENHPLYELILRCSSWSHILRTTVYVLRFLKILPRSRTISATDLWKAELRLIKIVQHKHFHQDIERISKNMNCSTRLCKLKPFLQDGLLRVGGRLSQSDLAYNQRHPIILPSKDKLIDRLIDFYHIIHLHTGPHLLESLLRQKYWILAGRNTIRARVHACNRCFRLKPTAINPLMADLPLQRVRQAKVFLHTGVDYFGPVNITLGRRRGAQIHKAYVCLFVCMSVKAVHMELVSSLSTLHFLQAFKRFLSRRGPCTTLYSDRGSNFIGAKKILSDLNGLINSKEYQNSLETELSYQGVLWKLNPAKAPHMGGLWESNVKSAKNHIYRVIGEQLLTYEEFNTVLIQVEALLNSRPLCQLSTDCSAPQALTPAHFLTLAPLNSLPAENILPIKINRLDRFQLIDKMVQDFWKRWHLEYLHTLQIRRKWNDMSPNLEIGTLVVLKCDSSPPLHWPLAVIQEVHPGKDGIVRTVTLKTNRGMLVRPVIKVCPLPTQ
ncbi:uncharacterized protein [Leptinotarsa decemlineata]|uniref:uncharacterized protein n=1 Tax=Leptinotarsa decemlineata TaxID=7539 RepID=UPI003D303F1C